MKHKGKFIEMFMAMQSDTNPGKIALFDYFIYLQECFYEDTMSLMERKLDEENFFGSVNSYKRLIKIAESYFLNVKGIGKVLTKRNFKQNFRNISV